MRDCRIITGTDPLLNEKNWIFFSHDGHLYFTYSISDGVHQVYRVRGDRCEPIYRTDYEDPWKWGIARGGTQLIQREGLWYGFFHGTAYQYEDLERRYFMGAYAVSPEPPFPIVKMSRAPLYTPTESFYRAPDNLPSGRTLAVVFPSGLILEGNKWLVGAGYNDHAIKLFGIGHGELESGFISTTPENQSVQGNQLNHRYNRRGRFVRVHGLLLDHFWTQPLDFVEEHLAEDESVFADGRFIERLPELLLYEKISKDRLRKGINWIILHKGRADLLDLRALNELKQNFTAVFANDVFVVFTSKLLPGIKSDFDSNHVQALWMETESRKAAEKERKSFLRKEITAHLNSFLFSFRKRALPKARKESP